MQKRKIIIIDPNEKDIKQLGQSLQDAGNDVMIFRNGEEAYTACIKNQPSIILSELFLPDLNGVQLFQKLKTNYSTQQIPFVLITRETERDGRIKSMQLGIDDYIPKPFYTEEVVARIEMLLSETEVVEETRQSMEHGFAGSLSEMNLLDLIQTLEVGDKSAILRLSRNGQDGIVYVENGMVRDALMENLKPDHALKNMLTWIDGKFFVEIQPITREPSIKLSNKEIFEYATKKIHEYRQLANQLPPLDTYLKLDPHSSINALSEEEREVALTFEHGISIGAAVESSKIGDLRFLRTVKQLLERNVLIETDAKNQTQKNSFFLGEKTASRALAKSDNMDGRISSFFAQNGRKEQKSSNGSDEENGKKGEAARKEGPRSRAFPKKNKLYLSKEELLLIRQKLS